MYDEVEHVSKQRLERMMVGGMAPAVITLKFLGKRYPHYLIGPI